MRRKVKIKICLCIALLLVAYFLNRKCEVIAVHPLRSIGQHDLKVMTWNVHCSTGADSEKQKKIAGMILDIGADFVLLNECNQDSCKLMDSILKATYPFTEETLSHDDCGDIFYSKRAMSDTGRVYEKVRAKRIQPIKATIAVGVDSVKIIGVHMTSNHYDSTIGGESSKDSSFVARYKNAQNWRNFQSHGIKEAVLMTKHHVIVMGDMNDFSCSAPLDTLALCGLRDSWWEGGNGYGATYHKGCFRLRIDHILYSEKLHLESIKVIETKLSDHNPVVASFSLLKE